MPITGGPGLVAITASIPLYVTSSAANPVFISGAISVTPVADQLIHGLVNITASIPLSVTSTLAQPLWVTGSTGGSANVQITGSITLPVSATNPVTASISNFPTSVTASFSGVMYVTSTVGAPVWVAGTVTVNTGSGQNVNITASIPLNVTSTAAAPIWVTGILTVNTGADGGSGGNVNITASIPLSVTSTVAAPIWVTGSTGGSSQINITQSIPLTAAINNFPATMTASFSGIMSVSSTIANPVYVVAVASAGALTKVAATGTVGGVLLLATNTSRRGATVFNSGTTNLYVGLGFATNTASFAAVLIPQAYYEVPFGFVGLISGAWDGTPAGSATIVEIT